MICDLAPQVIGTAGETKIKIVPGTTESANLRALMHIDDASIFGEVNRDERAYMLS